MRQLLLWANWLALFGTLSACQEEREEPTPPIPTAAFTCIGPFSVGDSTRFVNSSLNATKYRWLFGDGNSSTAIAPAHAYQQPGRFDVQLQAINNLDTARHNVIVNITARPPAGYSCSCKVTKQDWNGGTRWPRVRLPDENLIIGTYGINGMRFKNVNYISEATGNTISYSFYRSSPFTGSTGGIAYFYSSTDSVIAKYHSGGLGGGTDTEYRCKNIQ